jgi:hypothetical protein
MSDLKRDWINHREKPIDDAHSVSSITKIIGHQEYIEWCSNNAEIQEYWRKPEYIVYSQDVPVLTSNVNPGDFFNHGDKSTQIGIVSKKITLYGKPGYADGLRDSIHPTSPQYIRYECGGEMGGYIGWIWHDHGFGAISSGYFIWLPLPIQLTLAGFYESAKELNKLMDELIKSL